jgi:hypothetical protein
MLYPAACRTAILLPVPHLHKVHMLWVLKSCQQLNDVWVVQRDVDAHLTLNLEPAGWQVAGAAGMTC